MTWNRDSHCLLCACINWFTCCLISSVSLVVAVPVGHFNASPRKGNLHHHHELSLCLSRSFSFAKYVSGCNILLMIGRSMVVGHILMDHTYYLMCTNHRDMTAHTPDFLTDAGTTQIYVEHSTARHILISHIWSNAGRMVTHPCTNRAYDCLT